MDLTKERILVTGGHGFLGKHFIEELKSIGVSEENIISPTHDEVNLLSQIMVRSVMSECTICVHLAALVGGIGLNQAKPADLFAENMQMGLNIVEVATAYSDISFKKLLVNGTVCGYPKHTPTPFKEEDFWNGYPEETNAPYGIAKKALMVYMQAARQQYGLNGIFLLPTNLYGPGDNFDDNSSHVIPALIKKIWNAKKNNLPSVEIWGTGNASRDFLYVKDCARGLRLALENYDGPEPINLGSGKAIKIKDLVNEIVANIDYAGELIYNTSKPDGQPERMLDISRAKELLHWQPVVDFHTGLQETIQWYIRNGAND